MGGFIEVEPRCGDALVQMAGAALSHNRGVSALRRSRRSGSSGVLVPYLAFICACHRQTSTLARDQLAYNTPSAAMSHLAVHGCASGSGETLGMREHEVGADPWRSREPGRSSRPGSGPG